MSATTAGRSLAVVVVSHDSGDTLATCLDRVARSDGVDRLIVVDNASTDGAPQALAADAARNLTLVANPDNPGFGSACNQGAARAGAVDWIAFLNPDCYIEPDSWRRLLDLAAGRPDLALLGCDVRDGEGHPEPAARRHDPTLARILASLRLVAAGRDGSLHAADSGTELQDVDAPSGALMLVRRSAFEAVGGFDRGYRLHAEDLDLARRLRDAGGRVVVANAVRVTHLKGTSSRARPLFVAWHKHRGLARYFLRFGAGGGPVGTTLAVCGVWLMFALRLPLVAWSAARTR